MRSEPLVTVNILSFNRKEELRITLTKVFEQDYKNIEVIVVDNASEDGTQRMVQSEFPAVKLIQLKKNIGIAGWNKGFEAAKGEYVLVLDDDSYPEKETICDGVKAFNEGNKKLGIVAFKIYNNRYNFYETEGFTKKPRFFVGCGAMISKNVLNHVGFFNSQYFIYYHELDYSARCYDNDYDIILHSTAQVIHNQTLKSRGENNTNPFQSGYRYKYYFLSYSIFLIQNFNLNYTSIYLIKWWCNRLLVCIKMNYWVEFFQSSLLVLKEMKKIRGKKKILKPAIQKYYDYGNIELFDRNYFGKK
ncbi:MAG: glycosyltransferase family 2 protein [Ignavibacteriae bacterium]|nr:glycosyltransferase family 2 protein [Ignavibacteriota bacterium]NOG99438.1 glycosyltransferase family 2 protein [Ignavibacteriota bacterium]